MPEPDFESIARTFMRDVAQLDSGGDYTAETKAEDTLALAEQLRQVWNARGAAIQAWATERLAFYERQIAAWDDGVDRFGATRADH